MSKEPVKDGISEVKISDNSNNVFTSAQNADPTKRSKKRKCAVVTLDYSPITADFMEPWISLRPEREQKEIKSMMLKLTSLTIPEQNELRRVLKEDLDPFAGTMCSDFSSMMALTPSISEPNRSGQNLLFLVAQMIIGADEKHIKNVLSKCILEKLGLIDAPKTEAFSPS